jgi:hypothetical protein
MIQERHAERERKQAGQGHILLNIAQEFPLLSRFPNRLRERLGGGEGRH